MQPPASAHSELAFSHYSYSIASRPHRPSTHELGELQESFQPVVSRQDISEVREQKEGTHLIVAIELKILFRLESIGVWLLWSCLNALSNIGQDFLDAEHPIGVQTGVSVCTSNTRKEILPGLQDERDLNRLLQGDFVLPFVSTCLRPPENENIP